MSTIDGKQTGAGSLTMNNKVSGGVLISILVDEADVQPEELVTVKA
jgi:hypothetical protein